MPSDISFLPDDLRGKEEELKKQPPPPPKAAEDLKMHLPSSEEESIEIIEVDEGEISEVLAGEPAITRILFRTQAFFQELFDKLFRPHAEEPPPKLPPQFFKPPPAGVKPVGGLVPLGGAKQPAPAAAPSGIQAIVSAAGKPGEAKLKARIMPEAQAPRRVRVIKRVRKPVRVSFLEDEELRLQAGIPKRRFTLIVTALVFIALLGGSGALLWWQGDRAKTNLADVQSQVATVESRIKEQQGAWATFQNLEPRLTALGTLLNGHVATTKVFYALENNTVPDVSYSSFTYSPDGHVALAATAASFQSAARQIVAFRQSGIATDVQAMGFQATYDDASAVLAEARQIQAHLAAQDKVIGQILAQYSADHPGPSAALPPG